MGCMDPASESSEYMFHAPKLDVLISRITTDRLTAIHWRARLVVHVEQNRIHQGKSFDKLHDAGLEGPNVEYL